MINPLMDGRHVREMLWPPCLVCAFACALTGPAAVSAQTLSADPWFRAGTVMITVQAGGAAFTDFQRGTARSAATEVELQQFQRRVSAQTTGSVGGWVAVWLSRTWGVRGGVSYAPSSFQVRNEQSAQRLIDARTGGGEANYARLHIALADAAFLIRFPPQLGRVIAYGIAGGGVIRYAISGVGDLPPEARSRFARGPYYGPTGLLGVGATIPLQKRSLLLNFEFTDHMAHTPLDDAGAGEWFDVGGLSAQLEPEDVRRSTDGVGMTSTIRLLVGLTVPFR